jgi:two-component system, LytTR family, sensor kinase
MYHPIFRNLRTVALYFGTWIIIGLIHFCVLYFFYGAAFDVSLADGMVFNISFSIISLPIWYTVRYSKTGSQGMLNQVFGHIISLFILMFIWVGSGYSILHGIFQGNVYYIRFLERSVPWRITSGFLYYLVMMMVYYLIMYYTNLQEKMKNEAKLNEMVKDSELNLLKAQINPHFLFNSLNSVSSLIITDPPKAQEMLSKLSDFLRYTVSLKNERFSSVRSEFENTRRYLDIEKVRFGSKLEYAFELDEQCLSQEMPVMILQPLFENAVKHGVYESTGKVVIRTRCICEDCCLTIIISNNFEAGAPLRKGTGTGLQNIRERLKLLYQNDQLLKIKKEGDMFEATLVIPVKNAGRSDA